MLFVCHTTQNKVYLILSYLMEIRAFYGESGLGNFEARDYKECYRRITTSII